MRAVQCGLGAGVVTAEREMGQYSDMVHGSSDQMAVRNGGVRRQWGGNGARWVHSAPVTWQDEQGSDVAENGNSGQRPGAGALVMWQLRRAAATGGCDRHTGSRRQDGGQWLIAAA